MDLDIIKEEYLIGRCEKQMLCMANNKRCVECDGYDIYGTKCKFYERKVIKDGCSYNVPK